MARNSNLKLVAVKTEAALGRANSAAHKVAKAGVVARKNLRLFPSMSRLSSGSCRRTRKGSNTHCDNVIPECR